MYWRSMVDAEDLTTVPPNQSHVKRFNSKKVDIQKKKTKNFVFPCRTGKIFQEEQPLSTAVDKERATSRKTLNTSLQKKEARDPDPDVAARQDFRSSVGDYLYRNHVAPR